MAQVSKICEGGQASCVFGSIRRGQKPKSVVSISFRSESNSCSSFLGLKSNRRLGYKKAGDFRVLASVGTAEKTSNVSEIVLQPINDISGTITLPGSKSLSNRVLLLAALAEVRFCFAFCEVLFRAWIGFCLICWF